MSNHKSNLYSGALKFNNRGSLDFYMHVYPLKWGCFMRTLLVRVTVPQYRDASYIVSSPLKQEPNFHEALLQKRPDNQSRDLINRCHPPLSLSHTSPSKKDVTDLVFLYSRSSAPLLRGLHRLPESLCDRTEKESVCVEEREKERETEREMEEDREIQRKNH